MYYWNPVYFIFALPALLLGLWAQSQVQSAYKKYAQVANRARIRGAEAAQRLLAAQGLYNVEVRGTPGRLSDHYDPRNKTLHLSPGVMNDASVASLGIVAHEIGHAMQDKTNYGLLRLRAGLVPVVNFGSWLGPIIFLMGMMFNSEALALAGLLAFAATTVFALVTLPVELDASHRALAMLEANGLVAAADERAGVRRVLNAAAWTYVAALVQALSTLLYYVFLFSRSSRRRSDF